MQSTARGLLSGAFWGLLVGGVVFVLAALALDARRTARLEAEQLAARPIAPVAWSQGQQIDFDPVPPGVAAAPAPRGVASKSDAALGADAAASALVPAAVAMLDPSMLPKLPTAPAATSVAIATLAGDAAVQPSQTSALNQPAAQGAIARAPLPGGIATLAAQPDAPAVPSLAGLRGLGSNAPQHGTIATLDSLSEPAREAAVELAVARAEVAARAKTPNPPALPVAALRLPRFEPAPSSQTFDVSFVALPDSTALAGSIPDVSAPAIVTPPVRFGRLIWSPPLGRIAARTPQAPALAATSDLRGPEPVAIALELRPPEEISAAALAVVSSNIKDWSPLPGPAEINLTAAIPKVANALSPPLPVRLTANAAPEAAQLPRMALVVAGDANELGVLPDWAGGSGAAQSSGAVQSNRGEGPRVSAIWLEPGSAASNLAAQADDVRAVLHGPATPLSLVEAVQQSARPQAPIYRHLATPDATTIAALQSAAARAARDGQVVIMVANDAAVFAVVDQWLQDNAEIIRPVALGDVLR